MILVLKGYSLIKHIFALIYPLSKLNTLAIFEQASDELAVIGTNALNIKYVTLVRLVSLNIHVKILGYPVQQKCLAGRKISDECT